MARLFDYDELKRKYETIMDSVTLSTESYDYIAKNESRSAKDIDINPNDGFDIFLSHSYRDKDIIPHIKKELESMGYSVYVDWITDKLLSRDEVTKDTAKVLQKRMQQSKYLFFATSENSPNSKWMPWELGYFDGLKNKRVAVLPISNKNNHFNKNYKGQEYLGLYCWIVIDKKYIESNRVYKDDIFIICDDYSIPKYLKNWEKDLS
jgi:hypothetical protein